MSLHHPSRWAFVALLAAGMLAAAAPSTFAGPPTVDPSTLQPEPPPGASCRLDGRFVICQTEFHEPFDAEPIVELPCGTLYQTSRDDREGIRWYEDGLIVRRFVSRHMSGYWSLSPTGEGPRVTIIGHSNFWMRLLPVSATSTPPPASTARPDGVSNRAVDAGPSR